MAGSPRKRLETTHDYVCVADESGVTKDRYLLVGCFATSRNNLKPVQDIVANFRAAHKMERELKWSRVSDDKETEYRALVDSAFNLLENKHAKFHMICFDTHQADHKKYNSGDADVGLNKLYYQLLLHRVVKTFGKLGDIHIRLDKRISTTPLGDLRSMLNSTASRDHGLRNNPVKIVEAESSKTCDILQVNDVLLGGFSAYKNDRLNGRKSKSDLARYIVERSALKTLEKDSPGNGSITYWQFAPKN